MYTNMRQDLVQLWLYHKNCFMEHKADIEAYLSFLKSGCTKSPVELLRMAGVDMASPKPVEDAIELFDSLIDEFESIMK